MVRNGMPGHARVVIIGGGVMGCSLAYHLTKLGWSDVVLCEKSELTSGSTWHAAGLCTHFAHNLTIMQMRAYSARLYSSLLEEDTGSPVSFRRSGALRVTRSVDRMDEFRHVQGIGKVAGQEFHVLTPSELAQLHPLARIDGLLGAFYEPNDGSVDPSQATQAMAGGARQRGARIIRENPVRAVERTASGEWLVRSRLGEIRAEHIVIAAGTWAHEIGRMIGLELPVVPMLHQYLVTDRIPAVASLTRMLPIIRDPEESWYVRQERDGLLVGPYEHDGKPWSIDAVPPEFGMELLPPDLELIEPIVEKAMARVPALAEAGIRTIVNGPITFTPDAGPLIGPAFNLDNAWLLAGSSMGVMEGGGAGKFLAEWMVGNEPPMDELAVDPRRFGAFANRDYRVAKAVESFGHQFGIHYPYEERSGGRPGRTSPFHKVFSKFGAVFGYAYGVERPNWFGPGAVPLTFRRPDWFEAVREECLAVRDGVGVADMTALAKFSVTGQDAALFMATLGANAPPTRDGRMSLIHALNRSGGIESEFTVVRQSNEQYYLTSAAAARHRDLDRLCSHADAFPDSLVQDVTEDIAVIALMGPLSKQVLGLLTSTALDNASFPWLAARDIMIGDTPVTALRVSYVGEMGYELHHSANAGASVLDAILDVARAFNVKPFGAYAMNAMRIEKGYRAWGLDLTSERNPIESGLAALTRSEGRSFVGRVGLVNGAPRFEPRQSVLLSIEDRGPDPFYLHPVIRGDRVVGVVSSGAYGHRVDKKLALAYLHPDALDGGDLSVEIIGERLAAQTLSIAPYDPGNKRLVAE